MTHSSPLRSDPSPTSHTWIFHIYGLASIAFALPILDLLARNVEFFVVHRAEPADMLWVALGLALVPGSSLVLTIAGCKALERRWFESSAWHWLVVTTIGSLVALIALLAINQVELLDGLSWLSVGLVCGGGFAFAYAKWPQVRRATNTTALAVLAVPAVFLLSPNVLKIVRPAADRGGLHSASAQNPVVFVLFDELSLTALLDEDRQVDRRSFPHLAALADDSIWFANAYAVADTTELAVPAILSGRLPSTRRLPIISDYPDNLFTVLGGSNEIFSIEPITRLCPTDLNLAESSRESSESGTASMVSDLEVLFLHLLLPPEYSQNLPVISDRWRDFGQQDSADQLDSAHSSSEDQLEAPLESAEDFVQQALVALGDDRSVDLDRFLAGLRAEPPSAVYFLHVLLPHVPWEFLPSGSRYPTRRDRIPGLEGDRWDADPSFGIQAFRRYFLQLRYLDRWIGDLVGRLQELEMYEQALIVLTADHGVSFRPETSRRLVNDKNVEDILPVPLLIKKPGPKGQGQTFDRPVPTIDIFPTMLDLLDVEVTWPVDGRSVFSAEGPTPLERIEAKYRTVELPEDLHVRKFETLEWKLSTFGTNPEQFWRAGTHPELVGQAVESNGSRPAAEISVRFRDEFLFLSHQLDGVVTPALINGSLAFGNSQQLETECCDLAISVNGVIQATIRSYGNSNTGVRFSAIVPPSAFVGGDNVIEVWKIGLGTSPQLEFLGSTRRSYRLARGNGDQIVAILAGERSIPLRPQALTGFVESARLDQNFELSGWAVEQETGQPPLQILVFDGDHLIYGGMSDYPRQDVIEALGLESSVKVGFSFTIPSGRLATPRFPENLRVFALSDQFATELGNLTADRDPG